MRRLPAAAVAAIVSLALLFAACAPQRGVHPSRGYILISLDTLRADHLGLYGYGRDTSPFLGRLAQRSVVFERAIAQYPSTLASHMSIFTGLYPQQHAVHHEGAVLAEEIATLPELFAAAGFRTAGYTEGGWMVEHFGFGRGFDEFEAVQYEDDTDVERTFERGLDFLRSLEPDEQFFLFLHTFSIHDPYAPPQPFDRAFWPGEPPSELRPTAETLGRVDEGELQLSSEELDYFEALYDGSILYVDGVLERFFSELEALGLSDEVTVIVTSDHGEEFAEHGGMLHRQVYPEAISVPLVVHLPGLGQGRRVLDLVETVDLAPTLLDLAGVPVPEVVSGSSLVPLLRAGDEVGGERTAYAEVEGEQPQRALITEVDGRLYQFVWRRPPNFQFLNWVSRQTAFETSENPLEFRAISFHRPREVEVAIDGIPSGSFEVNMEWSDVSIPLPDGGGRHRVELSTPDCDVPAELGLSEDQRCLSFKLDGVALYLTGLYRLDDDPGATVDLTDDERDLHRLLGRRLQEMRWQPVAAPKEAELPRDTLETLKALGYLD